MVRPKKYKGFWVLLTIIAVCGLPSLSYLGPRVFLNLTPSMPRGLYLKKSVSELNIGEIIVFKMNSKKGNFIKYIGGVEGDEFCIDERGALWVNASPLAQKNIDKYAEQIIDESECQTLKKGTFLVFGEHPDSYDSRYFGPVHISEVVAQVRLIYGI